MTTIKRFVTTAVPFIIVIFFIFFFSDIVLIGLNFLTDIPPYLILTTIGVYFLAWLIKGSKWQILLPTDTTSLMRSTDLIILGNFISLVLPAKSGDIARLRLQAKDNGIDKQEPLSRSFLLSTILMDRVWDMVGIVIVILGLVLWFQIDIIDRVLTTTLFIVLIIGLAFIYLILPRYDNWIKSIIPSQIESIVDRFLLGLTLMPFRKIPLMIATTSVVWILEGVILYILILGLDLTVSLWLVLVAVLAANLTKIVPITPGGFVLYEATIGFVISNLSSLTLELSIGVGILDSLFKNGYTLIWGFFSYLFEFEIIK